MEATARKILLQEFGSFYDIDDSGEQCQRESFGLKLYRSTFDMQYQRDIFGSS